MLFSFPTIFNCIRCNSSQGIKSAWSDDRLQMWILSIQIMKQVKKCILITVLVQARGFAVSFSIYPVICVCFTDTLPFSKGSIAGLCFAVFNICLEVVLIVLATRLMKQRAKEEEIEKSKTMASCLAQLFYLNLVVP